jgi:hypothetical protein
MLGGRLRSPIAPKKDDATAADSKSKKAATASQKTKKTTANRRDKAVGAQSKGVTLRIPSWLFRGLGVIAILALIGAGVWYFAIRDTGPSAAEKAAEAARHQQAIDAAARAQCQSQTAGLLSAEEDLAGRLSGAGLTEADYLTRVGNIAAAYGQTPFKQIQLSCLENVATPAENARNAYVRAASTWNNCVTDFNCTESSIDGQLQLQWVQASAQLNRAKSGLNKVQGP